MPEPSTVVLVAIVEDLTEVRQGLSVLINGTPGFSCASAYRTMEEALEGVAAPVPDLMLVDIGLPRMSGIDGIRILKSRYPALQLLVLTVYDDDKRIFDAICAGANGYLLKTTPPARLLESMQEVLAGGAPMTPSVARRVIALFREIRPPEHADYDLTPHELRLLRLLVEGHNFKSAAAELGVTTHAITFHMRRVYDKLQVHSKSEAVGKALRERIIR
jgi:DNA-binding NarL/FixJ family response regulator